MAVLIPFQIPEPDRKRLMEAGHHAMEAWNRGTPAIWQKRHAKVELVISEIRAKYGVEEQEKKE